MLIMMLVSRLSGPIGLGMFATILTTALFSSNICKIGLENIALVEAPRLGNSRPMLMSLVRRLLPIFGLGILLSFATIAAFFVAPSFKEYFSSFRLVLYVSVFVIFFSYQFILGELFRAREAFLWASLSKGGLSNLIMMAILAWTYFANEINSVTLETLWLYMLVAAGIGAFSLTTLLFSIRWESGGNSIPAEEGKNLLLSARYYLLTSLVFFLVSQSDIWISASVFGAAETGRYAAASRLVLLVTFVASLANGFFTPQLSILAENDDMGPFENMLRAVAFFNAFFGFIVVLVLFTFAEPIILLIFGEGFERSGVLLRILLLGQVASVLVGPVGYALIILHQGKTLLIGTMIGLVTGLGLVVFFAIWGLSQVELALSYAVGNVTLQLAMYLALKRLGVSALPSVTNVKETIYG